MPGLSVRRGTPPWQHVIHPNLINPCMKGVAGMPANVESMFSVRQMPWHQEGIILGDYPGTWAEARVLAGLDWEPVPADIHLARWHTGLNPVYEPVEGWKAICRSDTGTVMSVNKDSYTVIGHGEMGEIVAAVLAQPNVKWETAGVL